MKLSPSRRCLAALIAAGSAIGFSRAASAGGQLKIDSASDNFCAAYGADFVPVAGTRTCVRISGHVRVEMDVERPARFKKTSPFDTPADGALTAVSSPNMGPLPRGYADESVTSDSAIDR